MGKTVNDLVSGLSACIMGCKMVLLPLLGACDEMAEEVSFGPHARAMWAMYSKSRDVLMFVKDERAVLK